MKGNWRPSTKSSRRPMKSRKLGREGGREGGREEEKRISQGKNMSEPATAVHEEVTT